MEWKGGSMSRLRQRSPSCMVSRPAPLLATLAAHEHRQVKDLHPSEIP
jgi:hypothetical protein